MDIIHPSSSFIQPSYPTPIGAVFAVSMPAIIVVLYVSPWRSICVIPALRAEEVVTTRFLRPKGPSGSFGFEFEHSQLNSNYIYSSLIPYSYRYLKLFQTVIPGS